MVTRYDLDGRCDPVEGGSWVDYEDHQAETAQLQARVAELEAALRADCPIGKSDWFENDVQKAESDNFFKGWDAAATFFRSEAKL